MDDVTGYTARDLARIALARKAATLADRLHDLVGRHGHDVGGTHWLDALVPPVLDGVAALHAVAVRYARERGATWEDIAAVTGVNPAQARDRWQACEPPVVDDPDKAVAELDRWFVRHLWLDPVLAGVPDPLRRLLDGGGGTNHPSCLICRKYAGGPVPAWAGWQFPPGGHLIDDAHWRVSHGPSVFSPRGTLLVESRRHFLDYADMTAEEAATYGPLVSRLMPPMKRVTGAERVHVLSTMDGAPHFHVWLFPRRPTDVKGRAFLGDPGSCTENDARDAINEMRAQLTE